MHPGTREELGRRLSFRPLWDSGCPRKPPALALFELSRDIPAEDGRLGADLPIPSLEHTRWASRFIPLAHLLLGVGPWQRSKRRLCLLLCNDERIQDILLSE